jgi:hypothetical protein
MVSVASTWWTIPKYPIHLAILMKKKEMAFQAIKGHMKKWHFRPLRGI